MDRSSPEQGHDLEHTLSCISHGEPEGWLPAEYMEDTEAGGLENGIAAEAANTGWRKVPWRRYPSEHVHYVAQHFGIGPGHELYGTLEETFPADVLTRRSKKLLAEGDRLPATLPAASIKTTSWKDLVCVAVLFHIAKKYYKLHGDRQMTEFERGARQRLRDEEARRAADKAAEDAAEAGEVPPRRTLPWEKEKEAVPPPRTLPWGEKEVPKRRRTLPWEQPRPQASDSFPETSSAAASKRYRSDSPEGGRAEASEAAKRVCTGLEAQHPRPRPQPAAAGSLDTPITTKTLSLFLSAAQEDPEREHVTARELLAFVSSERGPAP